MPILLVLVHEVLFGNGVKGGGVRRVVSSLTSALKETYARITGTEAPGLQLDQASAGGQSRPIRMFVIFCSVISPLYFLLRVFLFLVCFYFIDHGRACTVCACEFVCVLRRYGLQCFGRRRLQARALCAVITIRTVRSFTCCHLTLQ